MKRKGVYILNSTGVIWLVEKVEYYEEGYSSPEFSIVVSGIAGETKIDRCLITKDQYKLFTYLGSF